MTGLPPHTQTSAGNGILGPIGCLLVLFVSIFFGVYTAKYLLIAGFIAAPLLILAAYFTNPTAVSGLISVHFGQLRHSPGRFIVRSLALLLFLPFVALFIFVVAYSMKRAQRMAEGIQREMESQFGRAGGGGMPHQGQAAQDEEGFDTFEELDSKPLTPPKARPEADKPRNPYEDLMG